MFGAAAGDMTGNYFFAGGRSYNHTSQVWDYLDAVWEFNSRSNIWNRLPNLRNATGSINLGSLAAGALAQVSVDAVVGYGAKVDM